MQSPRETVYAALFAKFSALTAGGNPIIKTATRRLREYQQMVPEQSPALFQLQRKEHATKTTGLPTAWRLHLELYIWIAVGGTIDSTAVPSQVINPITDAIEKALDPNGLNTFYQGLDTLGVEEARILGDIEIFEDVKGDGSAELIVPIEVLVV
jgi:hypothetical protein